MPFLQFLNLLSVHIIITPGRIQFLFRDAFLACYLLHLLVRASRLFFYLFLGNHIIILGWIWNYWFAPLRVLGNRRFLEVWPGYDRNRRGSRLVNACVRDIGRGRLDSKAFFYKFDVRILLLHDGRFLEVW